MEYVRPFDPATGSLSATEAWTNGNPSTGVEGSIPPAEFYHAVLSELCHVIDFFLGDGSWQSGQDGMDNTQIRQAILAAIAANTGGDFLPLAGGNLTGTVNSNAQIPFRSTEAGPVYYPHASSNVVILAKRDGGGAARIYFRVSDTGEDAGANLQDIGILEPGDMFIFQDGGNRRVLTEHNAPFSQEFISAPQTITAGSTSIVAHGLSVTPKMYVLEGTVTVAHQGFLVTQVVNFGASSRDAQYGHSITADTLNLILKIGGTGLLLAKPDTTISPVDLPNFEFRLRAYA